LLLDSSTEYFWRVTVTNACGGTGSETFSFFTEALPGDCPVGQAPVVHWSDDMENGENGWTHEALAGQDTWALSDTDAVSPVTSWRVENVTTISDQVLVSPVIDVPVGVSPLTLQFYAQYDLEENGSSACWDGGLLEYSNDGGANWTVDQQ
jgi:hypothetical protein